MDVLFLNFRQLLRGSVAGPVLLVGLVSGCAHLKPTPQNQAPFLGEAPLPKTLTEILQQDNGDLQSQHSTAEGQSLQIENGEIIAQGIRLKNAHFDIPITINSKVEFWIDYFCGRGRGYFEKYLERSEYFVPYIVPLLKQSGLPEDLVYLAMIESGFNNLARSRAKAVGPWQFISATGKRYGLMVNWWVDERRDTGKATMAAVGYLKDLYTIFQSWELAAAAYNAGEAKIARAVRRFGSKDFWVISRQRFLRPETRDYVPKIIAAAIIAKNRTQFGFPARYTQPGTNEVVAADGELVKLIKTDKPAEDPRYKEYKDEKEADLSKGTTKILDSDDDEDFASNDTNLESYSSQGAVGSSSSSASAQTLETAVKSHPTLTSMPLAKPIQTPHVSKSGQVAGEELADFEVQSPADLLKVARAAGLSYGTVKSLNPEILRWCTPPTVGTYRLKLPAFARDKFLETYNHVAFPRKVQFMTYKVRRGDTLARIAQHFGIKVDPMSDLNGIPPRMILKSGAKVLLPMPNDRSRTFASLEVRDPPERGRRHRHRRNRHGAKNYRVNDQHHEAARSVGTRSHTGDQAG